MLLNHKIVIVSALTTIFFGSQSSHACNKWDYMDKNTDGECKGLIFKHKVAKKEVYVGEFDDKNVLKTVDYKGKESKKRMGLYFNKCDLKSKILINGKEISDPYPRSYKIFYSKTKALGYEAQVKWKNCDEKQDDGSIKKRFSIVEISVNTAKKTTFKE